MTKRRAKTKPDTRGPLQRLHDRQVVANDQSVLAVITDEQRAKGTYQGERRIINNHDPVMRWKNAGKLSESQWRAIEHMRHLWDLAGLDQRVTATYGTIVSGGGCQEHRKALEIDARHDLHRIHDYVPSQYFSVFELVCRFGEPAGVAGSTMMVDGKAAQTRAHTIVCFVADVVAMKERL